jgi:hypothetical protein
MSSLSRRLAPSRVGKAAIIAATFSAVTVVAFFPLVRQLDSAVIREPGDASSAARDYWAASVQRETPFTLTLDRFLYAPEGQQRSPAVQIANAAQPGFVMAARHWLGFLGALNLYMLIGFPLTALAMFALLRRLLLHPVAAFFGAPAFAFSWWQGEQVIYGHTAFTHLWVFPLLVIELLWLNRNAQSPRAVRGIVVGATLAASFYLSSYLGLIASVLAAAFMLVELVANAPARRLLLRAFLIPWVVTLLLLMPALLAPWIQPSSSLGLPQLPVTELTGSNLIDFLLPSAHHPVFGALARSWRPGQVGEHVLFFGFVTIALAIGAIVRRTHVVSHSSRVAERLIAFRLAVVLIPLGIVLSLPGYATVFGSQIPLPSAAYLVGSHVSWWRIYSRFGILVGFALALLAAFAIDSLMRSRLRWRLGLVSLSFALLAIELLPGLPVPTYRVDEATAATRWLRSHPGGAVALYPMAEAWKIDSAAIERWDRYNWGSLYAQTHHGHPLYALPSLPLDEGPTKALRLASLELDQPATARVLRYERVRFVVVNRAAYRLLGLPVPQPVALLRPVARFGNERIYAVGGPRVTRVDRLFPLLWPAIKRVDGFEPDEVYEGKPARWMRQDGIIQLHNPNMIAAASIRYRFTLRGFSNRVPRRLTLVDKSGEVLGRIVVDISDQDYVIDSIKLPSGSSQIRLQVTPGPAPLDVTDPRRASIFVRSITVGPLPRR